SQADVLPVRMRLDAESIEYWMLDELTAQVTAYAAAIGGIRLQIREKDTQKVIEILKEMGYVDENSGQASKTETKLQLITSKIPLLRLMRFELRIMIIIAIAIGAIATIIYFATL
ncbi:hypothetical protein LJC06_01820, partial [Bacteroidales bacterium OttesenSCG-928-I14]|nr:hypothetical protein [Bacteroidales bacterium OttesenSCG-928-I14]